MTRRIDRHVYIYQYDRIEQVVPIRWSLDCCIPARVYAQYPCGYKSQHMYGFDFVNRFCILLSFRCSILQTCKCSLPQ